MPTTAVAAAISTVRGRRYFQRFADERLVVSQLVESAADDMIV